MRWDFDGDGVWDTGFSTIKTRAHQFPDTGLIPVVLEVRDTSGLRGLTTQLVGVFPDSVALEAL